MNLFDNKAFGESWTAWIGRVTQQLKDLEQRVEQLKVALGEIKLELKKLEDATEDDFDSLKSSAKDAIHDAGNKLALLTLQIAGMENRLKSLEDSRAKVIAFVFVSIGTAIFALLFSQKK